MRTMMMTTMGRRDDVANERPFALPLRSAPNDDVKIVKRQRSLTRCWRLLAVHAERVLLSSTGNSSGSSRRAVCCVVVDGVPTRDAYLMASCARAALSTRDTSIRGTVHTHTHVHLHSRATRPLMRARTTYRAVVFAVVVVVLCLSACGCCKCVRARVIFACRLCVH